MMMMMMMMMINRQNFVSVNVMQFEEMNNLCIWSKFLCNWVLFSLSKFEG